MKNSIFTLLLLFLLSSCTTYNFYQVYKTEPIGGADTKTDAIVFEDENCKISYNLWGDKGDVGFTFYNKTRQNIYINKAESFFIINGIAYNYFLNRTFTNSQSTAIAGSTTNGLSSKTNQNTLYHGSMYSSAASTAGYSISYIEEDRICIPASAAKKLSEYQINNSLIRNCDLFLYPKKKEIRTVTYNQKDSPVIFSNQISYTVGHSDDLVQFNNQFYISEITNYPETEMFTSKFDEFCGEESYNNIKTNKLLAPDRFFLKYTKVSSNFKH